MSTEDPLGLCSLPNEILLYILNPFQTRSLLPLTSVSRRFHDLVLRLLHNRLLLAANITDHTLILECYHTSAKFTEPPLFCQYLGTDGLDTGPASETWSPSTPEGHTVGSLTGLYSKFVPRRREVEPHRLRRPYRAGDIPGSRTHPSTAPPQPRDRHIDDLVSQIVSLESHELFTQLCAQTNLAKSGPRNGLFLSLVEVSDGVIRIFRDWLARQAEGGRSTAFPTPSGPSSSGKEHLGNEEDDRILWVNNGKHVGVKLRVKERKWTRDNPILLHRDEDVAVSYTIEYEASNIEKSHRSYVEGATLRSSAKPTTVLTPRAESNIRSNPDSQSYNGITPTTPQRKQHYSEQAIAGNKESF